MTSGWSSRRAVLAVFVLLAMLPAYSFRLTTSARTPTASAIQEPIQAARVIKDNYIVVLRGDVIGAASVTAAVKKSKNIKVKREFDHAFKGFSAEMPSDEADKLKNDPRVALVEPDRLIFMPD